MASAESQLCSLMMRGLSRKLVLACFSYSVRAVSKRDLRLDSEEGSEDMGVRRCSRLVPRIVVQRRVGASFGGYDDTIH